MPYWSHACWQWLHTSNIPVHLLVILPDILPCAMCSNHMIGYAEDVPISTPTCRWICDLHNDVNRRQNKREVLFDELSVVHADTDSRRSLMQFVLACSFRINRDRYHSFAAFLSIALPTVGIDVPDPFVFHESTVSVPEYVYTFFVRAGLYTKTFRTLLDEYIPITMHSRYHTHDDPQVKSQKKTRTVSTLVIVLTVLIICVTVGIIRLRYLRKKML